MVFLTQRASKKTATLSKIIGRKAYQALRPFFCPCRLLSPKLTKVLILSKK